MKPFIRKKLPLILIAVQALLILGILFYIIPGRYRLYDIVLYDASENVPSNPLTGYAPPAERKEDCEGTELVFLTIPFSEWEPREGYFDTAGIEKKYHVRRYKREKKHAVVRFVCDLPGEEGHMDIPEWLYARTGDGVFYIDEEGGGYTPNYANTEFLYAHEKAVRALARWCRQDGFVAYVEAGSVGRAGDWSSWADEARDILPSSDTLLKYAGHYERSFSGIEGIRLLGSGSAWQYLEAGSWRDCLGDKAACAFWKSGEEERGTESAAEQAALSDEDKREVWTTQPVGAGMLPSASMDELLMDSLSDTLEQIRSCHISFIGPSCPDAGQQRTNGSGMVLRNVGYCIYLSRLQTTVDFIDDALQFHLTFANIGRAPMYWDWPVKLYIFDSYNELIDEQTLDLSLSELLPGSEITTTASIPYSQDLLKGYKAGISIKNPEGTEYVTLAQKGVIPDSRGIHRLYRYRTSR